MKTSSQSFEEAAGLAQEDTVLFAPARPSVLIVNFDEVLHSVLERDPGTSFDAEFFASDQWRNGPNSTQRLNFANLQAFRAISTSFDFRYMFHRNLPLDISSYFDVFDVVVVGQAPTPASKRSTQRIIAQLQNRATSAKVIFGTEMTWFKEQREEFFTPSAIRSVYTQHTLLRHTAKTDATAYRDPAYFNASIQEFELGLDCFTVEPAVPITQRDAITFVKGPEGRSTKNNDDIDRIRAKIDQSESLAALDQVIMEPPYTTTEYWGQLARTRYLVFTSLGETFSYVLNDAKSAGVVSYFPHTMYENHVSAFALDSYPDMPGRYVSVDSLIESMEHLERNPDRLAAESHRERAYVLRHFSLEKLASNWSDLFSGVDLNRERVLLVDLAARGWTLEQAADRAAALGCRYLVPHLNRGLPAKAPSGYSAHYSSLGVTVVRDFVYEHAGEARHLRGRNGRPTKEISGRRFKGETEGEVLTFWKMLTRIYKIGELRVGSEVDDALVELFRTKLHIYGNISDRHRPIGLGRVP